MRLGAFENTLSSYKQKSCFEDDGVDRNQRVDGDVEWPLWQRLSLV